MVLSDQKMSLSGMDRVAKGKGFVKYQKERKCITWYFFFTLGNICMKKWYSWLMIFSVEVKNSDDDVM